MGLAIALVACSGRNISPQPGQPPPAWETEVQLETLSEDATPESSDLFTRSDRYAVVWIPAGESLRVHQPAGIAGSVVHHLSSDGTGIQLTKNRTMLGTSEWLEIQLPDGRTGWVNSWNLTEEVSGDLFCQDRRIIDLIAEFKQAISRLDDAALAKLSSPKHGLSFRHEWWNPEVTLEPESLIRIFASREKFDWGVQTGSRIRLEGSFRQVLLPRLESVFLFPAELACNQLKTGLTTMDLRWPSEYANLNFYSVYHPAPSPESGYDWRTWAIGFEYLEGIPYMAVMVHYWAEF